MVRCRAVISSRAAQSAVVNVSTSRGWTTNGVTGSTKCSSVTPAACKRTCANVDWLPTVRVNLCTKSPILTAIISQNFRWVQLQLFAVTLVISFYVYFVIDFQATVVTKQMLPLQRSRKGTCFLSRDRDFGISSVYCVMTVHSLQMTTTLF